MACHEAKGCIFTQVGKAMKPKGYIFTWVWKAMETKSIIFTTQIVCKPYQSHSQLFKRPHFYTGLEGHEAKKKPPCYT